MSDFIRLKFDVNRILAYSPGRTMNSHPSSKYGLECVHLGVSHLIFGGKYQNIVPLFPAFRTLRDKWDGYAPKRSKKIEEELEAVVSKFMLYRAM